METVMQIALREAQARAQLKQNLQQWSADDKAHVDPPLSAEAPQPQPATSEPPTMTQTIFDYIRDNPGVERVAATKTLVARHGYSSSSVSSLIGQMVLQGLVGQRAEDNTLLALVPKFVSLKSGKERAALVEQRRLALLETDPARAAIIEKLQNCRAKRDTQGATMNDPENKRLAGLEAARKGLAQRREDPRFRLYLSDKLRFVKAVARGENVKPPKAPDLSVPLTDWKRKQVERELRARAQNNHKPKAAQPAPKAAPKAAKQAPANKPKAAVMDEAYRKAPASWLGPAAMPTPSTVDLRGASAQDIVDAMSITQARSVFSALMDVFNTR